MIAQAEIVKVVIFQVANTGAMVIVIHEWAIVMLEWLAETILRRRIYWKKN